MYYSPNKAADCSRDPCNDAAKPLIVDMGTQTTKVGFSEQTSGERFPSLMVPSIVGFPKLVKLNSN